MTFSMTGFAAIEKPLNNVSLLLELRAVNSRYLDLHFKLDESLRSFEPIIRELIGQHLSRGKIECKINLIQRAQSNLSLQLDEQLMQKLAVIGAQAQQHFPLGQVLSIADVLTGVDIGQQDPVKKCQYEVVPDS